MEQGQYRNVDELEKRGDGNPREGRGGRVSSSGIRGGVIHWGGIAAAVICALVILAVLWFVMRGSLHPVEPDGTLVELWQEEHLAEVAVEVTR